MIINKFFCTKLVIASSLTFIMLSCGKVDNFNSTDEFNYGEVIISGTPQFQDAAKVIQKRCTSCHEHSHWAKFTEDDYFANGLVAAQSLSDSPIYYRNKNATEGDGPRNMPTGGKPAMNATELETLVTWINSL